MKRIVPIVLVIAAIAAVLLMTMSDDAEQPPVSKVLASPSLAGVIALQDLDVLATRWWPVIETMDKELPGKVIERMGFDPRTAEGWLSVGADPAAGMAVAIDARVVANGQPAPVLLGRSVDKPKTAEFISRLSGEEVAREGKGAVRRVNIGGQRLPMGYRHDWVAMMLAEDQKDAEKALAGFSRFIADGRDRLAEVEAFQDLMAGSSELIMFGWTSTGAAATLLTALEAPEELTSTVDFYTDLFPGSGFWLGKQGGVFRMLATEKGNLLLRKLFVPQRKPPAVSKFVPPSGGFAVRFSNNLSEVLDGVAEALPPAAAQGRAAVGMARMMVPMAIGVTWDDLVAALSGHMVIAGSVDALDGGANGMPEVVLIAGVNDGAKADELLKTGSARAKDKVPGIAVSEVDFGGSKGYLAKAPGMELAVVRVDDVLIAGPESAVKAAVSRSKGEHLTGAPAEALDGSAMWAAYADLKSVVAEMEKQPQSKALLASEAMAGLKANPVMVLTVELERAGLTLRADSALTADVALLTAAAMWFTVGAVITTPPIAEPPERPTPPPAVPAPAVPTPAPAAPAVAPTPVVPAAPAPAVPAPAVPPPAN